MITRTESLRSKRLDVDARKAVEWRRWRRLREPVKGRLSGASTSVNGFSYELGRLSYCQSPALHAGIRTTTLSGKADTRAPDVRQEPRTVAL